MLFTSRKPSTPRVTATALIAGTVLAFSALSAPAYADDLGVLLGGGVGAVAGVVLGQHMGGRQGAIVGGALGAAVGVAASQSSGHGSNSRAVTQQLPDYRASGPGPDVRYYQNGYANGFPPGYAPVAYVPAYGPRHGYEWARFEEERRHHGHWNHGHDHGYGRDEYRRD
ncbi:MAG: hypothetical protein RL302_1680 [Pseudomonadota bacterium]|jgi:hypothetical protein